MFEFLTKILSYLTDQGKRFSSKALMILIIIFGVLLVDNILGFSYYFSTEKQINQIEKLNNLIKDPITDSATMMYVVELRRDIINRTNWANQASSFFRGKPRNINIAQVNNPAAIPKPIESAIRNNFLFHISAGGIYYALAPIFLIMVIFTNRKTSLYSRLSTGAFSFILIWGFGFFFYSLFNLIPKLVSDTWVWNYILNVILQFGLLLFAGVMVNFARKGLAPV